MPSDLIPIKDVPALVPGSPCLKTIRRWCSRGVRGRVLPSFLRGGRVFVSRGAVEEFINRPIVPAHREELASCM